MNNLETILEYFGNPPSKKFCPKTGALAFPYGQDGGEIRHMVIRYSAHDKKWRAGKKTEVLQGQWLSYIFKISEQELIDIAEEAYEAAR